MRLPPDFPFSQSSLQAFVDCPRRFYLRYIRRAAWPAAAAEPALAYERHMQQGADFHRLAHQHALGIPQERLSAMVDDPDLARWWHNYLHHPPPGLPEARHPEVTLSAPLAGHRLLAKYDLVALTPGERTVIVDWKTSRRRPRREGLALRLQTRVYPYVLVCAGAHLNGGEALGPAQVEMLYWFADDPKAPEAFAYDGAKFREDGDYLAALAAEIEAMEEDDFFLTDDESRCRFCLYRSLCARGVEAGVFDAVEDEGEWENMDLDFEQVQAIEF